MPRLFSWGPLAGFENELPFATFLRMMKLFELLFGVRAAILHAFRIKNKQNT